MLLQAYKLLCVCYISVFSPKVSHILFYYIKNVSYLVKIYLLLIENYRFIRTFALLITYHK